MPNGHEEVGFLPTWYEEFATGRSNPPVAGSFEAGLIGAEERPREPSFGDQARDFISDGAEAIARLWSPEPRLLEEGMTISAGDVLRLTYSFNIPVFKAAQASYVVAEVNRDGRFIVQSYKVDNDRLVLVVKVIKSPIPLAVLVAVIISAGAVVFLFLNFEKAEKLIAAASPPIMAVAAVVGIFFLYKLVK